MALRLISAKDVLGISGMLSLQDIGEDELNMEEKLQSELC